MSNFSPKLEDTPVKQLRHGINEHNPHYAKLESEELTRRYLKSLQNEIKKFNDTSVKYSEVLIGLTLILFGVAYLQLIIFLRTVASGWVEWIFLMVLISLGIYFSVIRQVFPSLKKKNKKLKN